MKDRDAQILQHIVNYCNEIDLTIKRFGKSEEKFLDDFVYRNAVSMPILQIGELVNHLSKDFTDNHNQIAWGEIIGMRNHFAHGYQIMNFSEIWKTAVNDIPNLNEYCKEVLVKNRFSLPFDDRSGEKISSLEPPPLIGTPVKKHDTSTSRDKSFILK